MTKTFAHQAAPVALAALLTAAMLLATSALASHQYHVAANAAQSTQAVATAARHAGIIGQRSARV